MQPAARKHWRPTARRATPSLPRSRLEHAVLAHAGRLVVFGGLVFDGAPGLRQTHFTDEPPCGPLVLDAAGTAWVSDPAVVPPLPDGFTSSFPMACSLPVG